ncbi:MAG: hypothetical protein KGO49_10365 [Gammaproteobacteria bacterium]|nr:hypothetical protein [Gammaproteobacteria bacterium]
MKLKLLACSFVFIGVFAHAESVNVAASNPVDQTSKVDQTTTNTAPVSAAPADSAATSAEAAREKALDDEFSKCVPNNPKYKNRCAMLEASKTSISHSQANAQFTAYLQMSNVYIKYLTDRESSGLGYCRIKGAAQAAKAKYDPTKNINEILELIAGCMAAQYQQVGKQETELNQIVESGKAPASQK